MSPTKWIRNAISCDVIGRDGRGGDASLKLAWFIRRRSDISCIRSITQSCAAHNVPTANGAVTGTSTKCQLPVPVFVLLISSGQVAAAAMAASNPAPLVRKIAATFFRVSGVRFLAATLATTRCPSRPHDQAGETAPNKIEIVIQKPHTIREFGIAGLSLLSG